MSEPAVVLEVNGHLAELSLNRPDRGNAMSRELLKAFAGAVESVRADASVRALLVRGNGKHFCTGADLRDGVPALAAELGGGQSALRRAIRALYEPFLSIWDLDIPTIAAVHGAAIGGGLGLALACDIRLCASDARLQANFVRLGIHPGMAVSWFLPRLLGPQAAAELLFTGRKVSGTEAAALGLVLRAVPPESLLEEARAMARTIAEGAPEALRLTKSSLRRAAGGDPHSFADAEALAQAHCGGMADAGEGVAAWMEKRSPHFSGA
ncbi:MAG: enoyl-CoA hydratase/isomerase family protein [Myxococcales bacterium]|nr:enoyl-CoA hydratase/isomerase family protein [Myxococcales bacterium]